MLSQQFDRHFWSRKDQSPLLCMLSVQIVCYATATGFNTMLEVRVGNTNMSTAVPPNTSGNTVCAVHNDMYGSLGVPIAITCTTPGGLTGRYVSIQNVRFTSTERLDLVEVYVYSTSAVWVEMAAGR